VIDPARHRSIFSPDKFGGRRVDVVGVGATGSRIALSLAKLGVQNLHVWDHDKVEEHNIANQLYRISDAGHYKVTALAQLIHGQTGDTIHTHKEAVTGSTRLGEAVFLLTDTMSSRREIFAGAMAGKFSVKLMIETRMGVDDGRIYAVQPWNPIQARRWLHTLYDDDDATVEASACGTSVTIGPTADLIAGFAVWQFIKWAAAEVTHSGDRLDFEVIFGGREPTALAF
jgi:hypothetical protein